MKQNLVLSPCHKESVLVRPTILLIFPIMCWAKSRQTCLCWDKQKTDMSVLGQTKDRHELCWDKQKSPPVQTELYVI
jgi:hypothetical protein